MLLLDYVEGFVSDKIQATQAAKAAAQRFECIRLKQNQRLCNFRPVSFFLEHMDRHFLAVVFTLLNDNCNCN